jgi:hypothetical protein
MGVVRVIVILLRAFLLSRTAIAVENLALRQQLAVLQVSVKRARLRKRDRRFWVWLARPWSGWRSCLMIVRPETIRASLRGRRRTTIADRSRSHRRGRIGRPSTFWTGACGPARLNPTVDQTARLYESIRTTSKTIEGYLRQQGIRSSELTAHTGTIRGWLALFAQRPHFDRTSPRWPRH